MLWQNRDQDLAEAASASGPDLPGYWELHHQEIVTSAELLVGILLFAVVIRSWMYRGRIRPGAIDAIAGALTGYRKVAAKVRAFWAEVNERAKS